ncbi:MAG TPA: hypothetical protein VEJ42_10085 [Streptosporangiaceae bacterium]|nr:hypothetical protein [Streptosporangiaceae bacterium]
MLFDVSTPAGAEKTLDLRARNGEDAARRDPPPSRDLRRAHIEPRDHGNAGLRVELEATFQRHRRCGEIRDRQEMTVGGQFRRSEDIVAELRGQGRCGFVPAARLPEDICEDKPGSCFWIPFSRIFIR